MKTEQLKRIFFDTITASISWVLFFYYRKEIIENSSFIVSETLIYGTCVITCFWLTIYILSGNYVDVRRVSRLGELYRTIYQSTIGCLIIFFFLIIDDIENYENYTFYYKAIFALIVSHFLPTFLTRYMITKSMVGKIQNRKIQFKTILIGDTKSILETFNLLNNMSRSAGYGILGYINCDANKDVENINTSNLGSIHNLEQIINQTNTENAILTFDKNQFRDISNIINTLIYHDIITHVTPNLVDLLVGKVKMQSFFNVSLIEIKQIKMPIFQTFLKRIIDIVFSMLALILLSPVLVIIGICVKATSNGPVLYYQERLGYKKKVFKIIKFRSMRLNAENNTPLLSSNNDHRITKWGKIMRKYRLDELPQFYNVLIGEMSIIGPRPERDFFAQQIILKAPHYKLIHKVKPGITSWGMVKFGYAENIDEMISRLKYDIIYIENLSLLNDFKVFILTILIVLQGRGK